MNLSVIPSDNIDELIAKSLLNSYSRKFIKELKRSKKTNEPEARHHIRVYARRLIAVFDFFSTVFPHKKRKIWYAEIKRLLFSLNKQRDLDVQLIYLKNLLQNKFDCQNISIEIIQYIGAQNQKQEKKISDALKRIDNKKILPDILQFGKETSINAHKFLSPSNLEILSVHGISKLRPLLQKFSIYRHYLPDPSKETELHKSRLFMKKIRYSVEILEPIYPSLYKHLKVSMEFQTILGEIHDCDIWIDFLDAFSKRIIKKRTIHSKEETDKLLRELKKLKALRNSERKIKHRQLVDFNEEYNPSNYEKQLLKSF